MVLSPVIPTADGAFWHGRAAQVPVLAAGRQSARRSAKSALVSAAAAAAVAAADTAAIAAIEAARVMQALLPPPPPPPEAAAKRAKGAGSDKGAKRKRESERGAEQPATPPGEAKTGKDKKEHDKYCHFCQHVKVNMMACEADDCTHRFCTYCLAVHLGIDTEAASSSSFKGTPWHCPTCSSKCCCSQPECTKAHRHCKAHRYRCRRAAAANLRMSAAHALVSLGGSLPAGKGKNKLAQQASAGAHGALENENKQTAQRPAKRRESPSPAGPQEGGDETAAVGGTWEDHDGVSKARLLGEARMEVEAGEAAVGVLASLYCGRSPSPPVEKPNSMAGTDISPESTLRLEQLAAFALQTLAAMEPVRPRSPSEPKEAMRELSDDTVSVMATPRHER